MKRFFWFLFLSFIFVLSGCQGEEQNEGNGGLSSAVPALSPAAATVPPSASPRIALNPPAGPPGSSVIMLGTNFMPGETIFLSFGESPRVIEPPRRQVIVDEAGTFAVDLDMPTLWRSEQLAGEEEVGLFALRPTGEIAAQAAFAIQYLDQFIPYRDEVRGFSLLIPAHWEVQEPQLTPLGEMILLGPPPVAAGNPAVSVILIAAADRLSMTEAADLLSCGEIGCRERQLFYRAQVGPLEGRSLIISAENTPPLEWFFVNDGDRLIYFTLHDPVTLATIRPLVDSLRLFSPAAAALPTPEATPAPTAAAEPAATPLAPQAFEWIAISINQDAFLAVVPGGGEVAAGEWGGGEGELAGLSLRWLPAGGGESLASAAASLLPEYGGAPIDGPNTLSVMLDWGEAREFRWESGSEVVTAVVVRLEDGSAYAFLAAAPDADGRDRLLPLLQEIVARSGPNPDRPQVEAEPTATAAPNEDAGPLQTVIDFLTILVRAEEDGSTVEYFSAERRPEIGSAADILGQLNIGFRPTRFTAERLLTAAQPLEFVVELRHGDAVATRKIYLIEENGRWRIDQIETLP